MRFLSLRPDPSTGVGLASCNFVGMSLRSVKALSAVGPQWLSVKIIPRETIDTFVK